jgi:hypothetical protein
MSELAELEADCKWAMEQLLYYMPTPMDTEASKVFDRARMWCNEHQEGSAHGAAGGGGE